MSEAIQALSTLQPTTKDAKSLVAVLKDLFRNFEYKFDQKFDNVKEEFVNMLSERNEAVSKLETEVVTLKDRISKLEERIESNDSYERRDTLIFSGSTIPAPNNSENCTQLVTGLIREHLQVSLQPTEISVCHRLPSRSNSDALKKHNIIVKFCRRSTKVDLLSSARKKKVPIFFINESLTPAAQTISYVLRKARREFPQKISGSTTYDGKNFVWVKPPNPNGKDIRHAIPTLERLDEFCLRVLEKPMSHFNQNEPVN